MPEQKPIIMYDSPEAASLKTVTAGFMRTVDSSVKTKT